MPKKTKSQTTPKKKKVIRRRRRRKGGIPRKLYFNAGTQAAIVAYQNATDQKERERLYVKEIMPAYEKLAENLINIHKFTSLHDSYSDLKNDCVNFLFETISKFDPDRGTNAFSYFNVVAKNWLIIKTKQKSKRIKLYTSLDDPDSLSVHESKILEDKNIQPSVEQVIDEQVSANSIIEILYDIKTKIKTPNELACINAIITIFENINDIDLLNKTAVLTYMRELSGLNPKQLTTTMQSIKKHWRKLKIEPKYDLF